MGSEGGRPTALDSLGIRREDIWNLAVDGLSNVQISKSLSKSKGKISVRTIATYRSQMPTDYKAQFEDFDRLPGVQAYKDWINSKWKKHIALAIVSQVRRVWDSCWRKPLESLTEQDIVKAILWIDENHAGSKYHFRIAIRTLIRFGWGNPSWLTKHLSTKGKKSAPRSISILKKPAFFEKTLPEIIARAQTIEWLDQRERDELEVVFNVKPTSGIRTGDRTEERELWGTKISAGKTNLQFASGEFVDWGVHAKMNESWHITFLPPKVIALVKNHIDKYNLRQGDLLISKLRPDRANKALAEICGNLGIEKLRLHDFRKIWLTGLCLSGVPLETAVDLNVGWKDINTARKYYLEIKALNAGSEYAKFVGRFFK